jgi:hypothetical protein
MNTLMPTMHGIIDRRMLVNFRVKPDVIQKLLPPYFRPKLVNGWAVAGICLIRLKDIRPRGFPAALGISSENAAHRIAVEWDENGITREGVYIPRRDTSSHLQAFVGGRIFPGIHHAADFEINEHADEFNLRMHSRDDATLIELKARRAATLPTGSIFKKVAEASEFFANGSVGYSATTDPNCCDGLELCTAGWKVEPLDVVSVKSSFFDDQTKFPIGTIHLDCALLMQNIVHEWRVLPQMKDKP